MVSSCIKNGQKQRPSCGHSPTVNDGFCPGDGSSAPAHEAGASLLLSLQSVILVTVSDWGSLHRKLWQYTCFASTLSHSNLSILCFELATFTTTWGICFSLKAKPKR